MGVFKILNLALAFLLELALLAAWGWSGNTSVGGIGGIALAILLPAAVAVIWGLALSPKPRFKLAAPIRLGLETLLFLGAGAGLLINGQALLAGLLVGIWIVNKIILTVLGQTAPD